MKNVGTTSINNVEAVVSYYTESDTFVTSDSALIEYDPLLPGQTSPFKVLTRDNPAISKGRVTFKQLFGATIPTFRPTPTPTPPPLNFEGSGKGWAGPFDLRDGPVVFELEYNGSGRFTASIRGHTWWVDIVDVVGPYKGRRALAVGESYYAELSSIISNQVAIDASGGWKVKVYQYSADVARALPLRVEGTGDDVIGPVAIPTVTNSSGFAHGKATVHLTHEGAGPFTVSYISVGKISRGDLVNVTGVFDKEKVLEGCPAACIIAIQAEQGAKWTVDIRP
ncbi:MAG: hypothetical protein Q8P22_12935 [Chloroflexota bacterium]|nr:hypothetical protein [Chloroflexota bacterium]